MTTKENNNKKTKTKNNDEIGIPYPSMEEKIFLTAQTKPNNKTKNKNNQIINNNVIKNEIKEEPIENEKEKSKKIFSTILIFLQIIKIEKMKILFQDMNLNIKII